MGLDKFKKSTVADTDFDVEEFTDNVVDWFSDELDLEAEVEEIEDGYQIIVDELSLEGVKDDILVKIIIYEGACMHIFFVMDERELTMDILLKLNTINSDQSLFRAFIDEFFTIAYVQMGMDVSTQELFDTFTSIMEAFSDDNMIEMMASV